MALGWSLNIINISKNGLNWLKCISFFLSSSIDFVMADNSFFLDIFKIIFFNLSEKSFFFAPVLSINTNIALEELNTFSLFEKIMNSWINLFLSIFSLASKIFSNLLISSVNSSWIFSCLKPLKQIDNIFSFEFFFNDVLKPPLSKIFFISLKSLTELL